MLEKGFGIDKVDINAGVGILEHAKWQPHWRIEKYHGSVCPENLYEVEEFEGNSLLLEGIEELMKLACGLGGTPFSAANAYIGVGDGTTATLSNMEGLQGANKTYRPMDATYPQVSGNTMTFRATFGANQGNHGWREFTIANGSSDAAKNLNRRVEPQARVKYSPDIWVALCSITIS